MIDLSQMPMQVRPARVPLDSASAWLLTGDTWAPALCALIATAKSSILMTCYAITPAWDTNTNAPDNIIGALANAAARGLRCHALIARHKRYSSTAHYNIRAATALAIAGWNITHMRPSSLLHAKTIVIDGQTTITGSHNLAKAASRSNLDISLAIHSVDTAAVFTAAIKKMAAEHGEN